MAAKWQPCLGHAFGVDWEGWNCKYHRKRLRSLFQLVYWGLGWGGAVWRFGARVGRALAATRNQVPFGGNGLWNVLYCIQDSFTTHFVHVCRALFRMSQGHPFFRRKKGDPQRCHGGSMAAMWIAFFSPKKMEAIATQLLLVPAVPSAAPKSWPATFF